MGKNVAAEEDSVKANVVTGKISINNEIFDYVS